MTIICAYRAPSGETWIGSDSQVNGGDMIYPEKIEKLIRLGPWTLGFAGSPYTGALILRNRSRLAEQINPQEIADMLQGLYKEAGYKQCDHDGPPCYEQEVVLAARAGVWSISGSGILGAPSWGFVAGGSGMRGAFGAAYVAHREKLSPESVVRYALEAAIEHTITCGGEPVVLRVSE